VFNKKSRFRTLLVSNFIVAMHIEEQPLLAQRGNSLDEFLNSLLEKWSVYYHIVYASYMFVIFRRNLGV
jgi:hypothetical protein